MANWSKIESDAKSWIYTAGETIRQSFQNVLQIQSKSNPDDLVTNMDKETEQFLISKINEIYPEHRILGEEGFGHDIQSLEGIVWIVDPIDGTMNFVHQQRNFAISIGIYEDGVGQVGLIYDVVHDELYHAVRGKGAFMNDYKLPDLKDVPLNQAVIALNATWVMENKRFDHNLLVPVAKAVRGTRSYGSATLEFAYVASGRLDAYITLRLAPWDFAAGLILLEEVGAKATTLDGEKINLLGQNSIFVAKKGIHSTILKDYLNK
ncbi:inositol monophosphatase family protein [Peribacillus frigoritolerans]|uniref:inositol monophosphatase family protein n=1 Tax=Peribacillus frigoritolerans TaxID=450367 RepID=UPI00105A2F0B|nr:inositol monophosphatase family protein [Peribacillus frigoritolerans]TDL80025.1 inositol monophosphatase family protein [Peribacillus frigoritolerans]